MGKTHADFRVKIIKGTHGLQEGVLALELEG